MASRGYRSEGQVPVAGDQIYRTDAIRRLDREPPQDRRGDPGYATPQEAGPDLGGSGCYQRRRRSNEGGLRPDDWADIARRLEATGKSRPTSSGLSRAPTIGRMLIYPTSPREHGYQLSHAEDQCRRCRCPWSARGDRDAGGGGGASSPATTCRLRRQWRRQLIGGDPDWVRKAERGEAAKGAPLPSAPTGARSRIFCPGAEQPASHNPAAGRSGSCRRTIGRRLPSEEGRRGRAASRRSARRG